MISRVLIANRGEIAVRIARGCAAYGVTSIAVYSDADAGGVHVRVADEAYALGGMTSGGDYLDIGVIIALAARVHADAIHPGYGFLSESAPFAQAVIDAGMTWIGPRPRTIALLGDKVAARALAVACGVPLVTGTPGPVEDGSAALEFAHEHGLPIAIKAAFGGGGRGLRIAWRFDEVMEQFDAAAGEARAAFGRSECFIEQYVQRPRHVEVQILADDHGHVVVLGTRDCSLQRRNQKVVEEAPAPYLTDAQRNAVEQGAARISERAGYTGAGTVEFLVGANGAVSFLEVNTRLQVEHAVTEMTSGVDIVRQQLLVADGLPLEVTGSPEPRGHAFEFRVNAEDAGRGFLPSPGRITRFDVPGGNGVRVDSGVVAGDTIDGLYDSLMAKLVVWGPDRSEAIRRARKAVREFRVEGIPTLLDFDRRVLDDPAFIATDGEAFGVHTRWIETECGWLDELRRRRGDYPGLLPDSDEAVSTGQLWRAPLEIDGRLRQVGVPTGAMTTLVKLLGTALPLDGQAGAGQTRGDRLLRSTGAPDRPTLDCVAAPVAGVVVAWKVADGAEVEDGQTVAVVEAMKMQIPVQAPTSGVLHIVVPTGGEAVTAGAVLARIG